MIWFATESVRPDLKYFVAHENKILSMVYTAAILVFLFLISRFLAYRIELKKTLYIFSSEASKGPKSFKNPKGSKASKSTLSLGVLFAIVLSDLVYT